MENFVEIWKLQITVFKLSIVQLSVSSSPTMLVFPELLTSQNVLNKLVMKTSKFSSLLKNFSSAYICKIVFVCRMISCILYFLC